MLFRATFFGRLKGAIGVFQRFDVLVEGADQEQARLNLYKTHEHLGGLRLEPVTEEDRAERLVIDGDRAAVRPAERNAFKPNYRAATWITDGVDPDCVLYRGQIVSRDGNSHRFVEQLWVCEHSHSTRDAAQRCAETELTRRRETLL